MRVSANNRFLPHIIAWMIVFALPIVAQILITGKFDFAWYKDTMILFLSVCIVFYLNYSLLIERFIFNKLHFAFISINISIIAFFLFLLGVLRMLVFKDGWAIDMTLTKIIFGGAVMVFIPTVILAVAIKFITLYFRNSTAVGVEEKEEEAPRSLFVKVDRKHVKIEIADINYVESDKDYLKIHLSDGKMLYPLMTMKKMEATLPSDKFFRVHRSFLVAIDRVPAIERGSIVYGNKRIPISDNCKEAFFKLLSDKNIITDIL